MEGEGTVSRTSLYVVGVTDDSVGEEIVDTDTTGSGRGEGIGDGPGIDSSVVGEKVGGSTVEGEGTGSGVNELRTTLETTLDLEDDGIGRDLETTLVEDGVYNDAGRGISSGLIGSSSP